MCPHRAVDHPAGRDYVQGPGDVIDVLVLTQDSGHSDLRGLGQDGRVSETGKQEDRGIRVTLADDPGGAEAVRGIREAKIEHARVRPVARDLGDPARTGSRGRKYLVATRLECDTQCLAQNTIIVTENKPHRPRSS
jgi:hypothetical protein